MDTLAKTELQIGSRVMIQHSSLYYESNTPSNPRDIEGTIIEVNDGRALWPIRVKWDNTWISWYFYEDLIVCKELLW